MNVYTDWLGIPAGKVPESGPPDHYELLRLVRFEDDEAKVQAHYKKLNGHVRTYASGEHGEASQALLNELAKSMLCLTDPQRKRDYDESLGREFAEEPDDYGRRPLDVILVEEGIVNREQAAEAEKFADARGLSLRDAVVQMKLADAEQAARALAKHLGRPYVDLAEMPPEDAALDSVPRVTVKKHTILPLFEDEGHLIVACAQEPSIDLEEELQFRFGMPMSPVITTPRAIQQALAVHYPPGTREEVTVKHEGAKPDKKSKKQKGDKKEKTQEQKELERAMDRNISFAALSPEQQHQRKQLGYLLMLWSVLIPALINYFVLGGLLYEAGSTLSIIPWPALFIAPAVYFWVTEKYWK